MTEPPVSDVDEPYGPSPLRRMAEELYFQPAWAAVAVELVFVLVVCNQYVVNHIAVPGGTQGFTGWARQLVDEMIISFSWTFAPSHGYTWLWLSGIVHVLLWLLLTFLLVRWAGRAQDRPAGILDTVAAVFLASFAAGFVGRSVAHPDLRRLYSDYGDIKVPGFGKSVVSPGVSVGMVLVTVLVGLLAALAVSRFAIDLSDEAPETA